MIIETIVTTLDTDGAVNIAPMGVEWTGGDDAPVLKPFLETVDVPERGRDASRGREPGRRRARVRASSHFESVICRAASQWWCGAWSSRSRARGASFRSGRSTARRHARASRPRSYTMGFGASSSDSTAHDTPCSRRRSTPPACTCSRATSSSRSSPGLQVIVDKTAGADEHEAMAMLADYIRSAPAPDQDGTR